MSGHQSSQDHPRATNTWGHHQPLHLWDHAASPPGATSAAKDDPFSAASTRLTLGLCLWGCEGVRHGRRACPPAGGQPCRTPPTPPRLGSPWRRRRGGTTAAVGKMSQQGGRPWASPPRPGRAAHSSRAAAHGLTGGRRGHGWRRPLPRPLTPRAWIWRQTKGAGAPCSPQAKGPRPELDAARLAGGGQPGAAGYGASWPGGGLQRPPPNSGEQLVGRGSTEGARTTQGGGSPFAARVLAAPGPGAPGCPPRPPCGRAAAASRGLLGSPLPGSRPPSPEAPPALHHAGPRGRG